MDIDPIAEGIATTLASIYPTSKTSDQNQVFAENVLAVTMKFDGIKLQGRKNDPSTYLNAYDDWFKSIMIQSFGNNLGRKKHLQPVSYAFVDFPGSRGRPKISAVEVAAFDLLHIHAVIALRPGDGQACRLPFLIAGSAHRDPRFGDVKVTPFNPAQQTPAGMIQYFKKGVDAIGSNGGTDYWDVFPRLRSNSCLRMSGNRKRAVGLGVGLNRNGR